MQASGFTYVAGYTYSMRFMLLASTKRDCLAGATELLSG